MIVVSGYRRSGTSAMMYALGQGGVSLICIPDIEIMNVDADYVPNPNGLFEIGRAQYMHPWIMRCMARTEPKAAVKVLFDGLPGLPEVDNHIWNVIFMRRNPEEIAESIRRSREAIESTETYYGEDRIVPAESGDDRWDVFREYNQQDIDEVVRLCQQRTDMNLHEVDFADLIADPLSVFKGLQLPIDCNKAAGSIDPQYYRVRK